MAMGRIRLSERKDAQRKRKPRLKLRRLLSKKRREQKGKGGVLIAA